MLWKTKQFFAWLPVWLEELNEEGHRVKSREREWLCKVNKFKSYWDGWVGLLMQMITSTFCKGENMKYCKDCKYCERDLWCVFPDRISAVTGKPQSKFCTVARNDSQGLCGSEAKWFEQKEIEVKQSLFNKIISWFK